ncbi:MAG TPA: hypothetical protein VED40_04370 [Azospirillaceae bacterium]|nr:hypothetical protein [Azospirillaceae bacterium]
MSMEPGSMARDDASMVKIVYVLYLVSLVVGVTSLVGLVLAYVNRGSASGWLQSHYDFQIRTFWIGLIAGFCSFILTFVLIGWPLLLLVTIWFIVRSAKGLSNAMNSRPMPDPQTYGFG